MPRDLAPMLACPAASVPQGDDWAFEIKWDGVRAILGHRAGDFRLQARRGADATRRYPELAPIAAAVGDRELILDGEIVALDAEGRPSFQELQRRMGLSRPETIARRANETPVTYIAFDLVWLDGESLCDRPYLERRELLAGLGFDGPAWRAPGHQLGAGDDLLAATRERGIEGIVAKRIDSPYRPGRRSPDWLKLRNRPRQEFVIGGWMPGAGSRGRGVGSLLVGHWVETGAGLELAYAGGVGTGFSDETLRELAGLLEPLRVEAMPFTLGEDPRLKYRQRARERGGGPFWARPELVCEVEFSDWTREATLRQSAFKGLRGDKDPREVRRET